MEFLRNRDPLKYVSGYLDYRETNLYCLDKVGIPKKYEGKLVVLHGMASKNMVFQILHENEFQFSLVLPSYGFAQHKPAYVGRSFSSVRIVVVYAGLGPPFSQHNTSHRRISEVFSSAA